MRLLDKLCVRFVLHHAVAVRRLARRGYFLVGSFVGEVTALVANGIGLELGHADGVLIEAFPDRFLSLPLDNLKFLLVFLNLLLEQLLVVLDCLKLLLN